MWLAFGGGLLIGLLIGLLVPWLFRKFFLTGAVTVPAITVGTPACLSGGLLEVNGTLGTPLPAECTLMDLHVKVYPNETDIPDTSPVTAGATSSGSTTFPINHTLPAGLTNPRNRVAVWAEYKVYVLDSVAYDRCPQPSGGILKVAKTQAVSAPAAERLEAIPRAYRVSPGSPTAGAGGPAANLVGELARAPEIILLYVPEDSSPDEPFWRARGGPGPVREWTLRLLHIPDGFGALLSAVCLSGGREVRLTWVTSDWRLHASNRLVCESAEAGGPALLVRPA